MALLSSSGLNATPTSAKITGPSDYTKPMVTDVLGKGQAMVDTPAPAYTGQLTAGTSDLQNQAWQGLSNLTLPETMTTAGDNLTNIGDKAQGITYNAVGSAFDQAQAQQYMNPYLQSALNPQLEEARRQSQITQLGNQAKATQAGAFGGGRSAIMEAETQRALGSNLANITGAGYNTAYDKAMAQFNADQTRQLEAQRSGEASRQFGATQGMTAAQAAAQYGLSGQQETEKSKQFGANYGLEALKSQLAAAQAQGALGLTENTANLANLQQQLTAGDTQRKIEAEGIKADLDEFNVQREFPYQQVKFQRDILSGLPVSAITSQAPQMNDVAALVAAMGGMPKMLDTAATNPSVKKLLKYLGLDLDEAVGP
jgi:hypothetical protein